MAILVCALALMYLACMTALFFSCDKCEVYGVLMCMITNVFLRKAR